MPTLANFGKYELSKRIGQGAMGEVYEGFDTVIGRRVAIKTLRTDQFEPELLPELLERFKREAQAAGRLSHPHIVTIYDYGDSNGTPYIVMEFIQGSDLDKVLKRGVRFPLDDVVRIMTQMLGALGAAHENGVVHRDIKPANIFMLEDGSLKVVDFGIARTDESGLTATGASIGTPAYMSPEQVLGTRVDARSDIFSAGIVLYQLLTGERPFTGSVHTIHQKVLHEIPLPPSSLNPLLAPAWDAVVERAMAKKPTSRFESARQFSESIKIARLVERAHEIDARRKADEATEHVLRAAEERSRSEAMRRAEEDLREAKQVDRKPDGFSSNRDAIGQGSSAISGVPKSTPVRSRRAGYAVLAAVVAVGVLIASIYARDQAEKHSAEANAALTVAQLARQDAEKARIAAEERMLAATRQAEAERRQAEADRAATKLADERAKKEALQQKKEAEERLRVEQAPAQREIATKKAAADAKAKAEQIEQIAAQRELTAKAKMRGVLPPCVGSFDMRTWLNCYGSMTWPDGMKYTGEFVNGRPNGMGTGYNSKGELIGSGLWDNGQFVR